MMPSAVNIPQIITTESFEGAQKAKNHKNISNMSPLTPSRARETKKNWARSFDLSSWVSVNVPLAVLLHFLCHLGGTF